MTGWLDDRPFAFVVAGLFVVVLLRAQGTYWIGRAASAGTSKVRRRDWLSGERMARAVAVLHRWGLPVIPLSFLTIGFQTVVNGAAGLTRMPWGRYTLAMLPGCVAWAFIYATAFDVTLSLVARSPWAAAALALVLAAVATALVIHRRRLARGRLAVEPVVLSTAAPDAADDAPA